MNKYNKPALNIRNVMMESVIASSDLSVGINRDGKYASKGYEGGGDAKARGIAGVGPSFDF